MKPPAVLGLIVVSIAAALLVAGCGGGGSSAGSSSTAPENSGSAAVPTKKATAPNAPAGSKVVACQVSGGDARGLRATAVGCGAARAAMRGWEHSRACARDEGGSRSSCSVSGFRCQAVRTGKGTAVSCARPDAAIAFIAKSRS